MKIAIFDEISYELFFFSFDEEKVGYIKKSPWDPIFDPILQIWSK